MTESTEELTGVVLVVEDDATTRSVLARWIAASGLRPVTCASAAEALAYDGDAPVAACVDLGLGDVSGLDVVAHLKAGDADLPILIVTAQSEVQSAVNAMQAGAYDYLTKPLDRDRLLVSLRRAVERRNLLAAVHRLSGELNSSQALDALIGESAAMQRLRSQILRVIDSDVPVCVFGESGTGKELVARAIHEGGRRAKGPFVPVNCGAIPQSLQESELFGHERGAFTGAVGLRRGRFEQANHGTIFLDELGEMSPSTQVALLRTLQERSIRRVGGDAEVAVDARVVCATHRELAALVKDGRFREDLYFRLVVYPIHVPALRERQGDIPLLIGHFLRRLARDVGRRVERVSPEALEVLSRYPWPGNVRELQNLIHRAMLVSDRDVIELAHLPQHVREPGLPPRPQLAAVPADASRLVEDEVLNLRELERRAIARALAKTGGNLTEAARELGIGRATIYRKLASYGLAPSS